MQIARATPPPLIARSSAAKTENGFIRSLLGSVNKKRPRRQGRAAVQPREAAPTGSRAAVQLRSLGKALLGPLSRGRGTPGGVCPQSRCRDPQWGRSVRPQRRRMRNALRVREGSSLDCCPAQAGRKRCETRCLDVPKTSREWDAQQRRIWLRVVGEQASVRVLSETDESREQWQAKTKAVSSGKRRRKL